VIRVVVDLEQNIGRVATQEEIDSGIFYADYNEWKKDNAA
jgi:hypothetical protein